jgi:nucleoside-diphosphate kinase
MSGKLQMTLALIKPTVCSYQPDVSLVLKMIKSTPGLTAVRQKRLFWKQSEAEEFYKEHYGRFYYDRLISGMTR